MHTARAKAKELSLTMCIQNEKIKQFIFVVLLEMEKKPVFVIKESVRTLLMGRFESLFFCSAVFYAVHWCVLKSV